MGSINHLITGHHPAVSSPESCMFHRFCSCPCDYWFWLSGMRMLAKNYMDLRPVQNTKITRPSVRFLGVCHSPKNPQSFSHVTWTSAQHRRSCAALKCDNHTTPVIDGYPWMLQRNTLSTPTLLLVQ